MEESVRRTLSVALTFVHQITIIPMTLTVISQMWTLQAASIMEESVRRTLNVALTFAHQTTTIPMTLTVISQMWTFQAAVDPERHVNPGRNVVLRGVPSDLSLEKCVFEICGENWRLISASLS